MKKKWIFITLILIVFFIFINNIYEQKTYSYKLKSEISKSVILQDENDYAEKEKLCLDFVLKKLSSKSGGIYTNYLSQNKTYEYATGHEILSESVGIFMLYCVKNNLKDEFDKQYELVTEKMINKDGLIKWRIKEDNINMSNTSASIDDIRIIKGLFLAYYIWQDEKYLNTAFNISNNLLKHNITKNILNNYKNPDEKLGAKDIDLSYMDVYTIKLLSIHDKRWTIIYNNALDIIKKGYISDKFPFYKKNYNIDNKEFDSNETINMIDTTLVLLHLSEIGQVKKESINWLKSNLKINNVIYGEYNIDTKAPVNNQQSTAVYAIIVHIGRVIKDEELYNLAINKMLKLQVLDENSVIYGSFGNKENLEVYSFDNLLALLSF